MPGPPSASTRASPVGTALETIVSSPSSSAAVALSCVSAPVTRTTGLSPEMTAVAPSEPSVTRSGPSVPWATTWSTAPSPVPSNPARFTATLRMSVPVRSPTVTSSALPSARIAAASTPSTSSVMLAMLRNTVTRGPLASSVICSPALEPLKSSVSVPPSPSTTSEPSPGSHCRWSLPEPPCSRVGADVAVHEVVAGPAEQRVRAVAAAHAVVAVAAVERQRRSACRSRSGRRACRCRCRP